MSITVCRHICLHNEKDRQQRGQSRDSVKQNSETKSTQSNTAAHAVCVVHCCLRAVVGVQTQAMSNLLANALAGMAHALALLAADVRGGGGLQNTQHIHTYIHTQASRTQAQSTSTNTDARHLAHSGSLSLWLLVCRPRAKGAAYSGRTLRTQGAGTVVITYACVQHSQLLGCACLHHVRPQKQRSQQTWHCCEHLEGRPKQGTHTQSRDELSLTAPLPDRTLLV